MRRRCPWRKPVVFMRRSAWIEEELLVYFTCTHTYTHTYIYIPTKKPASEGKPPRLVKPATAETDTKTDGLQAFWSKKKEKEKLVARLKSSTSLSVCTTTSRATSSDDIITFVHAHEYLGILFDATHLHFPTRPLFYRSSGPRWKKEVPLNFSLKKIPTPFYKGQGFPNSFFLLLRKK